MSHRKIRSQGYIPFSWEEKPGVPKISHQKSSSDVGLNALSKILPDKYFGDSSIVPPPPFTREPPRKCYSGRLQDDPFLVALKSCSDSITNRNGQEELRHKGNESKRKNYIKGSFFSCKQSCNVENDNLVKFSKLPPIPKERYNAKSLVRNSMQ